MKILIVSNMFPDKKHPSYGIFVENFCKQLDRLKISYDKSVMLKSENRIGKAAKYFKLYASSFFKSLFRNYSAVYIHYASYSSIGVLLARKIKKFKIIVNLHGSDVIPEMPNQEKMHKYTEKLIEKSFRVVVPSEYFKDTVSYKYGFPKDRIYVYPSGGVSHQIFYQKNEKEKQEAIENFGLDKRKIRIGFVGRISPGKGWDTYIEAISLICQSDENAVLIDKLEFVLVGSGQKSDELEELISVNKLGQKIKRYPLLPQEKLADMYNCFDVFVFSTRLCESLGLVALEAMACGAVVIASDFAAQKYYIDDGVNGFKFELGNAENLADKIVGYLSMSEEKKRKIIKNAIETSMEYDAEKNVSKLDRILQDLKN